MKNCLKSLNLCLAGLFIFASCAFTKTNNHSPGRTSYDFDLNWKFKLGDETKASDINYNDANWRTLNVPHDWSIEGAYNKDNPSGIEGAFLPTGIGWYRKHFEWLPEWENKKLSIQFDGVYCNSTVWINGIELGTRPNGYIGFSYDLTPHLQKGNNVISVKVDHSKTPSGRWYTGSGIYRHVRLLATDKIYIPEGGLLIKTPEIDKNKATVAVNLELTNEKDTNSNIEIIYNILDASRNTVTTSKKTLSLKKGNHKTNTTLVLKNPALWSTNQPNLYKMQVQINDENHNSLDNFESTFGVRSISFSAENGFELNGVKTILKGVCNHHDAGPVGTAVPHDVLYRRLEILKEMGCNAIRTSHNPFAPEFYDMCDEMGFLVMDEAFDGWETPKAEHDYGNYFEDWWQTDLEAFIKRDYNHPSVIIWSIGNEVKNYTDETQKKLVDFIKDIDNTRPISQGRGYKGPAIDLAGFNGHGEYKNVLKKFHKANPTKPIIGTEITHTMSTRGIYRTKMSYRLRDTPAPWEQGKKFSSIKNKVFLQDDLTEEEVFKNVNPKYYSSYDNAIVRMSIRDYWRETKDLDYFLGAFRWTGFDYLGESFDWPARTVSFGIIDLAGFPTDSYYLYQSIWSNEPMVHLLPHWSLSGKEGVIIPVVAYTNGDSAELFLNGKSLGEKPMTDEFRIIWNVPYIKGELKVVAKKDGKIIATDVKKTAEEAHGIAIKLDKKSMISNQKDVAHLELSVVDKNGVEVPDANNLFNFKIEGPGKLIGVENGDILDLSPSKATNKKAFNGKCLAIVQSTDKQGDIKITISSEGLVSSEVMISVHKNKTDLKSL
ncbi:sugar-binding domain-containing protein [Tamlana sp. I1]|uniref:sugar-binding domain-containing protein n=1 Tax=Tamlana sp. I1 TaxID=2762061 RepID=UPI00188EF35D|nr:sugar-binding domain-containing protein [Tamlana sp. I1]